MERFEPPYELILNSTSEGIIGLDLEGNHTFVNLMAARMLGYKAEELLGRQSHSTWHHTRPNGSPYPREECSIYAAYRDGKIHRTSNEVFWRKDGLGFPVEYSSTPIRKDGQLVGAVVVFTDITKRKLVEEELRQALEQVKTLRGILSICSYCKKIRDGQEHWIPVEVYVRDHTEVDFSHGICPECIKEFFPDFENEN